MEDMKDIVLNYVIEEYLEDEDEEISYDTPLISGGIVDSFSMVSLKRFLENKIRELFGFNGVPFTLSFKNK